MLIKVFNKMYFDENRNISEFSQINLQQNSAQYIASYTDKISRLCSPVLFHLKSFVASFELFDDSCL